MKKQGKKRRNMKSSPPVDFKIRVCNEPPVFAEGRVYLAQAVSGEQFLCVALCRAQGGFMVQKLWFDIETRSEPGMMTEREWLDRVEAEVDYIPLSIARRIPNLPAGYLNRAKLAPMSRD
jgi:hypothetical protein